MAHWGGVVRNLPRFFRASVVSGDEGYLSLCDQLVQYDILGAYYSFSFQVGDILSSKKSEYFYGLCHNGVIQGGVDVPLGEDCCGG